jgi:hypothetical protein
MNAWALKVRDKTLGIQQSTAVYNARSYVDKIRESLRS